LSLVRRADRTPAEATLAAWKELKLEDVSHELLDLAEKHIAGERASSDTLSTRLTATVTLAGALLAVGVTLAGNDAKIQLAHGSRTLFSCLLVSGIVLLVGAMVTALAEIRPRTRVVPNPDVLRHYAKEGTAPPEIRADTFKLYGAALEQLGNRNSQLSSHSLSPSHHRIHHRWNP
jgi:hypothetical protein